MKQESKQRKRRSYDAEFKFNILKMHKEGRSVSILAESFGINENLIYRWKSLTKASSQHADKSIEEEKKRLRSELKQTQQERDILKKALSIFSRQH